jgi:hypothetical protein
MKTSLIRKSQSIIPYSEEEKEGVGTGIGAVEGEQDYRRRRDEGGGGREGSLRNGKIVWEGEG